MNHWGDCVVQRAFSWDPVSRYWTCAECKRRTQESQACFAEFHPPEELEFRATPAARANGRVLRWSYSLHCRACGLTSAISRDFYAAYYSQNVQPPEASEPRGSEQREQRGTAWMAWTACAAPATWQTPP